MGYGINNAAEVIVSGSAEIKGSATSGTSGKGYGIYKVTTVTVSGAAKITGTGTETAYGIHASNGEAKITVNDANSKIIGKLYSSTGAYTVTAGQFDTDPTAYLDTKHAAAYDEEAETYKYTVVSGDKVICDDGNHGYVSVQKAVDFIDTTPGKTITMVQNSEENVEIKQSQNITLDLNGHVLKGTGSGSVIKVNQNAALTLKDSNSTAKHYFKVGSDGLWTLTTDATDIQNAKELSTIKTASDVTGTFTVRGGVITGGTGTKDPNYTYGGGVFVISGKFKMTGGSICGNSSVFNGGGVAIKSGEFEMTGGSINGNKSLESGGGVSLHGASKFTMSSGSISGNKAGSKGGGVNCDNSKFEMTGGSINGNTSKSHGGGVLVNANDNTAITVGGTAQITGNTLSDGTTANNLYLVSGKTVTVSTETPLASGASFGVTTQTEPVKGKAVDVTSNGTAADMQYFHSDKTTNSNSETIEVIYEYNDKTDSAKAEVVRLAVPVAQIDEGTDAMQYSAVQKAVLAAGTTATTVKMIAWSEENVVISQNQNITLDLNGKALYSDVDDSTVVRVEGGGTFTLKDSDGNGKITHTYGKSGCGVYVDTGAVFNMTGGMIRANSATIGGGVCLRHVQYDRRHNRRQHCEPERRRCVR